MYCHNGEVSCRNDVDDDGFAMHSSRVRFQVSMSRSNCWVCMSGNFSYKNDRTSAHKSIDLVSGCGIPRTFDMKSTSFYQESVLISAVGNEQPSEVAVLAVGSRPLRQRPTCDLDQLYADLISGLIPYVHNCTQT